MIEIPRFIPMKKLLACAFALALASTTAFAASPWDGTWKLDRSKSHFTGASFTYSKTADGKWKLTNGPISFEFAPDGKPYPILDADHTITVTLPDAHTMKSVSQFKGKTTATSVDTLSADGNTLTDVTTGTHEDGSAYTSTETDARSAPGEGFLGTWTSTKASNNTPGVSVISTSADGTATFVDPTSQFSLNVKLDGTPAKAVSPQMTEGVTFSYKKTSATRLDYSVMLKGSKVLDGYMELAKNGKTYQDVSWLIGKESEKQTAVYSKVE
jgi:hypothetical protein